MQRNHIILFYLLIIIIVTTFFPTVSSSYNTPDDTVQYIENLSKDIYYSLKIQDKSVLRGSKGLLKLKIFLSPWGEIKDVYVSESSGKQEIDELCVNAVRSKERYEPFPEKMGDKDIWIEVPIVFKTLDSAVDIDDEKNEVQDFSKDYSQGDKDLDLTYAVDIAKENHIPIKIAEGEIGLARLKILEANRALYPSASINFLETTGKTAGVTQDFTDREYKLRFEYPLYYGWRLKYAVGQALANLKASTANYEKSLQDLRVEVELAYYSYLVSKKNLRIHKELLEEVSKIMDIAEKRFNKGLSTKAEFLQVQSQLRQIQHQVASSENEVSIARLTLAQAMNVEEKDGILDAIDKADEKELEPIEVDIPLEKCVEMALRYRPDLKAKEEMVRFNDYEMKIQKSKDQLRVDLTGSYGKSGGAYESETLTMGDDWMLGFKVTKPLGANTVSTGYTKDKTSQKHGQSTRTESESKSIEFGILDGLQHLSEHKSAEIAFQKAQDELQQTKDTVIKEVKDSYLSYKKALSQIASTLNKIRYREEELKLIKARAELNDASLSDLIQAHMNLSDERSFYVEAAGSLYQALAKLNKATGFMLFIDDESFQLVKGEIMPPSVTQ